MQISIGFSFFLNLMGPTNIISEEEDKYGSQTIPFCKISISPLIHISIAHCLVRLRKSLQFINFNCNLGISEGQQVFSIPLLFVNSFIDSFIVKSVI